MLPFQETNKGLHLFIRVTPNAKVTKIEAIEQLSDGRRVLKLRVKEVPDKGKANKAAMDLLSKFLHLPKSQLSVVAGETSRNKTLLVQGLDSTALERALADLPATP